MVLFSMFLYLAVGNLDSAAPDMTLKPGTELSADAQMQKANTPNPLGYDWDPHFKMSDYELGPGDMLTLNGFGGRVLSLNLHVSPEFRLIIPTVGSVDVKGKRFADVVKLVQKKVQSRYKDIVIEVVLQKPREFKVQIRGEVISPGFKMANPLVRLQDFLTISGGLRTTGSTIGIEIENFETRTKRVVNYQKFLLHGELEGNPFMKYGDSVNVPVERSVVTIKGNLLHTGRFEFAEETSLLKDVVEKQLGGFVARSPVGGQVVITRIVDQKPVTQFIETDKFFDSKENLNFHNFELRTGDQIFFPAASIQNPGIATETVFVTGEVRTATAFPYRMGTPLSSYLAVAGGITVRANYDEIVVYKASGAVVSIRDKPTIEPGDTIHVPEKTFKFWQDHLTILMTFLTLVTTTIAISR